MSNDYTLAEMISILNERYKKSVSIQGILGAAYYQRDGKDYQIVVVEYSARWEAQIFLNHQMVGSYEASEFDIGNLLLYIMDNDPQFIENLIAGAKAKIDRGEC
jgi:hypothetical protein